MTHLRALGTSIFIHLALVALIWLKSMPSPLKRPLGDNQTQIEWHEAQGEYAQDAIRSSSRPKARARRSGDLDLGLPPLAYDKAVGLGAQDSRGEDSSQTALSYGRKLSIQEQNAIAPYMHALHRRVDESLTIEWDYLGEEKISGVTADITINADGSLKRVDNFRAEKPAFAGMIRSLLSKTLMKPLELNQRLGREIPVRMQFKFQIIEENELPPPLPIVMGNLLSFTRYKHRPVLVHASQGRLDEREKVIAIKLEVLFEKLFRKKPNDPKRIQWDLELRLSEARAACDTQRAEGACLEAGKIEEAFGRLREAHEFYLASCGLAYEQGCSEANRICEANKSLCESK